MYYYVQRHGGVEDWKPVPASAIAEVIANEHPMFVTALAVNKLVEEISSDDKHKLAYFGPYYVDFDTDENTTLEVVLDKVRSFMKTLEGLKLDLSMVGWYATGSKGFHCEIPPECFMEKLPKSGTGVPNLPVIYKEMTFDMYVDTMDMRVYSQGRGRMWRQINVMRDNGHCKVQLSVDEVKALTPESYQELTSAPRTTIDLTPPKLCVDLAIKYEAAKQKVEDRVAKRGKKKVDPKAAERASATSVKWMMSGIGLKEGVGFHELAFQIAIIANTAHQTEEEMLTECALLIEHHKGNGLRYNTPAKRREELLRMYRYIHDNVGYDFSIGAIKVLLSHPAVDLDGVPVDDADLKESIDEAEQEAAVKAGTAEEKTPDEYNDVASGVTLTRFGVYVPEEDGSKRRICAVSFENIHLLLSTDNGQMVAYEAEVLVNGRRTGRQTLELETFQSTQMFNRFCQRMGHVMQGTETHLRGLYVRFVELAKKKGRIMYIAKREGLDILNIPNAEDEALREPFMVWADGRGVILDPRVRDKNLDISFQGYPDPRGLFKTDIADAPHLVEWLKEVGNKELLRDTLHAMMTCQRADVMSKLIGWYTACFYRMLFHKAYTKFPLLHINGAAGAGKTEMNRTMSHLFYYNQEPKMLTPQSSLFAIQQHLAGSASLPLIVDEYKPHDMTVDLHSKMKLLFRDAYNNRDILKGGGTRESEDYRTLHHTQLSAPLCFIAEAAEEEAAVAERVVLVTVVKPSSSLSLKWLERYHFWDKNKKVMAILGQYLASQAINTMTVDSLRQEFDAMYSEAQDRYMLTAADLKTGIDDARLSEKQSTKDRSVFNFTVAKYGLMKFRNLVESIFGVQEFAEKFKEMDEAIYSRMSDLNTSTQAEWAKVLGSFSSMTYALDGEESPHTLRPDKDYAMGVSPDGRNVVELVMRTAYMKYRGYMRASSTKPLFPGEQSFLQALKDSPALIKHGVGDFLLVPGVYQFDADELTKLGVSPFRPTL